MKEVLQQYGAYNTWANQKLTDYILTLPVELQLKEVPSSFKNLHDTLLHMWSAEYIWWQRLKLLEPVQAVALTFKGDTKEVVQNLLQQNRLWQDWINTASTMALEHEFKYRNSKREEFKQPVYQMLMHLFNHDTYHRGQLVTILRELGETKLPSTDFILWSRSTAPKLRPM